LPPRMPRELAAAFERHVIAGRSDEHARQKYLVRLTEVADERGELALLHECNGLLAAPEHPEYGRRLHALYLATRLIGKDLVTGFIRTDGGDHKLVITACKNALGLFHGFEEHYEKNDRATLRHLYTALRTKPPTAPESKPRKPPSPVIR